MVKKAVRFAGGRKIYISVLRTVAISMLIIIVFYNSILNKRISREGRKKLTILGIGFR